MSCARCGGNPPNPFDYFECLCWQGFLDRDASREVGARLVAVLRAVLAKRELEVVIVALGCTIEQQAFLMRTSDADIATLLEEHIMCDYPIFSPKSDLVGEAIDRLRRKDGAKEGV